MQGNGAGGDVKQDKRADLRTELEAGGEEVQLLQEDLLAITLQAQVQESGFKTPDIWEDNNTIQFLTTGQIEEGASKAERDRVRHRAAHFRFNDKGGLQRRMMDGTFRQVPKPDEREALIVKIHTQHGHFGQRRTTQLVMLHHWWTGLYKDCAQVVGNCEACGRVNATFNSIQPTLNPLPVRGMMYR